MKMEIQFKAVKLKHFIMVGAFLGIFSTILPIYLITMEDYLPEIVKYLINLPYRTVHGFGYIILIMLILFINAVMDKKIYP
jgi:hypothetical protein